MNNSHNISTLFFDFGGVLLQHMDGIDHRALETRMGLPHNTFMRCLYMESRYMEFQVGDCTWDEWVDSVLEAARRLCGERAPDVLRAYQQAERPLNQDMIGLVKRLRARGYRTGIISNTIPGLEDRLRAELPHLIPLFDVRIGSGDLRIAKPDPRIYLHAAQSLGVDPAACVFTDDVRRYAEAAREVGMHGFHFKHYEQFVEELRSVGVQAD